MAGARQGVRVAFQGELGAFSEEAVQIFFGSNAEPVPCREFRDVGMAIKSRKVDYGALPVENTVAGGIGENVDMVLELELELAGEVVVPVHHCVLVVPGTKIEQLRKVISHPMALAQCEKFFAQHPAIQAVAVYDTAGAAMEVKKSGKPETAAIASRGAAQRYGLEILAANVEDRADNQTRFLIAARRGAPRPPRPVGATGRKTAILLDVKNEPGSLVKVLQAFSGAGINLSKIESRPTGEPWTYRFFLEFDTDAATPNGHVALEEARARCRSLVVLGTYDRVTPQNDKA
jgi:prephenate dehydratase